MSAGADRKPGSAAGRARPRLAGSVSAPALPIAATGGDEGDGGAGGKVRALGRQVWIECLEEPASPKDSDVGEGISAIRGSGSRPGTSGSLASPHGSLSSSRPGSRRFSPDELKCFRRVYTPSKDCDALAETYFQTTGLLRHALTMENWNSLPVLKGKFYNLPGTPAQGASSPAAKQAKLRRDEQRRLQGSQRERRLPDEELTSSILDQIYPRQVPKRKRPPPLSDSNVSSPAHGGPGASPTDSPTNECAVGSIGMGGSVGMVRPTRICQTPVGAKSIKAMHAMTSTKNTLNQSITSTKSGGRASISMTGASMIGMMSSAGGEAPVSSSPYGHGTNIARWTYQASGNLIMLEFRNRLLQKYASINEACERFSCDAPPDNRGMTKKEWRRVLLKQGLEWSNKEKDMIFEELDFRHDGHITLSDVHIAVEAAAPVRSMEDLRRRWLASGYPSMTAAIRKAEDLSDTDMDARIPYEDFCKCLKTVSVLDASEHQAVFAAICSDRGSNPKVSLEELLAAIATVSPDLLLEDTRARIMKQYGSIDKAYNEIDRDKGGTIESREFSEKAITWLGLSIPEAKKAFRLMDIDGNGEITRDEFVSALRLAEPSLCLEDLRLKIRRSFRSILEVFRVNYADPLSDVMNKEVKVPVARVADLMRPLDFKDSETRTFFELIDVEKAGQLTCVEIIKGIHHFAPACALEDLRVRCIQRVSHVSDAFVSLSAAECTQMLSLEDFTQELFKLELIGSDESELARKMSLGKCSEDGADLLFSGDVLVREVYDLLDVVHSGCVSLGRVIASLQSCGAGSRLRLPPRERDEQAMRDMKDHLWPKKRLVNDLKTQVRLGTRYEEKPRGGHGGARDDSGSRPGSASGSPASGSGSMGAGARRPTSSGSPGDRQSTSRKSRLESPSPERSGGAGELAAAGGKPGAGGGGSESRAESPARMEMQNHHAAPRLKQTPLTELVNYMDAQTYTTMRLQGPDPTKPSQLRAQGAQDAWGNVWQELERCPPPDIQHRKKLEGGLHKYFQSASMSMSHDGPLLSSISQSSVEQYHKMKTHKAALGMA
mmetsp:Transcript_21027/g.58585  ORF Transcript_21027/g.58585 Transcript_21027/m.58585 type:complete len:1059 (+) Transcript_21027:149-3325(+)